MTVIGGQIAVDSFFFLGGFLCVPRLDLRRGAGRYRAALWFSMHQNHPGFRVYDVLFADCVQTDGPFFVRFQQSVFRRCDNAGGNLLCTSITLFPLIRIKSAWGGAGTGCT